jgi:hypothetical protein
MNEIDGPNADIWSSLKATRPPAINEFSTLPILKDGIPTGILAAISSDGRPHLLVPIEAPGLDEKPLNISLKGLDIKEVTLKLSGRNSLVLDASSEPSEEAMFTVVARELARAVAIQGRDPRKASEATVRRWRSYWATGRSPITTEAQLGLFTELHLLGRHLIPRVGLDAVNFWRGPHRERHDFQGPDWHIECKATTKSAQQLRIHGHDQLIPPEGKHLLLYCVFASREAGGRENIEREVDHIRSLISGNIASLDVFEESLSLSGFYDIDEAITLRLRQADFFVVDSEFPTLGILNLPSGVIHIDWDVDLSSVLASEESLWASIIGHNNASNKKST